MKDVANGRLAPESRGVLYVVGTPIGNLQDITLRALQTLKDVDLIAAEDTRNTRRLLAHHGIDRPLISLHEHNEDRRAVELVSKLETGLNAALVSDAGTPTLSDPGYRLVKVATAGGIKVVPIPGPSAAIAALSVSGLPTDSFVFLGFPPRKQTKRLKFLHQAAKQSQTLIFYESPKRMADLLGDLQDVMGERQAVLSREMTKRYEEFIRGKLGDIAAAVQQRKELKGECTLLVEGVKKHQEMSEQTLREIITRELDRGEVGVSALSRQIAKQYGISKNRVYEEVLVTKRQRDKEIDI